MTTMTRKQIEPLVFLHGAACASCQDQVAHALERIGLVPIGRPGETDTFRFDLHEGLGAVNGDAVEVLQPGWRLPDGTVLARAKVEVIEPVAA